MTTALAFELPASLEATAPPEARGLERDQVKLLVAGETWLAHARFRDLPDYLRAGDVLVVNDSATLPAAVPATLPDGSQVRAHYATAAPGLPEQWAVLEIRARDGARRGRPPATGTVLRLAGGATVILEAPYARGDRLALARLDGGGRWVDYLQSHGEPIRYGYAQPRPLSDYQTVYARTPGSAEMASAGRPITERMLDTLADRGVTVATITLHAGVSSPERHEPPIPERYSVPAATAAAVNGARRVIAVGTTVVRALESAAADDGRVHAAAGWTNVVITPERAVRAVDALITGWHEPEASHLQMLEAIAGPELLSASYAEALAHGYLWHEFGDSHLLFSAGPSASARRAG